MNHESVAAVQKRHGRSPEVQLGKPVAFDVHERHLHAKLSPPCDALCWSLRPSWNHRGGKRGTSVG